MLGTSAAENLGNTGWMERSGINRNNGTGVAVMGLVAVAVAAIVILTDGNLFAVFGFLTAVIIVAATAYRVQWGFFLMIGLVLSLDQFDIPEFIPLTLTVSYFRNIKEIPYLPAVEGAVVNPLELHFLFILGIWFIVAGMGKKTRFNPIPSWGAAAAFYAGLIASVVYGLQRGGDFLVSLWEVRALFYLGVMYVLVPQIIQTRSDLRALVWTFVIAISFKAFQGIERFVRLGFSTRGIATLTNHEDPLFMVTLFLFLLAFILLDIRDSQRSSILLLMVPLLIGFFVAQRRAAYAAVITSMTAFFAFLAPKERWIMLKGALPVLLCLAVYCSLFWESESRVASPVRLIKTALSNDKETAGERYYSNLYREFEKFDLMVTMKTAPLTGIGFGNKYLQPIPLAQIPFPLRDYIPHNEVLWLLVKMGAAGFFLFWFFLNCFACNAAIVLQKLKDPYLQAVCIVAAVAVVGQITVSFYDLQLTYYRNMIHLGTLMGVVSSLEHIDAASG